MENTVETVPTEDVNQPVIPAEGGTATPPEEVKPEQAEKTFTQAEVDALIQKRLLKEQRRVTRQVESQLREQLAQPKEPPKRESFGTEEAFNQAQIEHLIAKQAEKIAAEREEKRQEEKRREAFLERAEKASERYADFESVIHNPSLTINAPMAEYIAESENGPDVAYFLGKNPLKAAKIAALSPVQAARELARIEFELASKPKANVSKAPDPITPVGARGKSTASAVPTDDDDIETWMRKERQRVRSTR